jgi:hypothetical protein
MKKLRKSAGHVEQNLIFQRNCESTRKNVNRLYSFNILNQNSWNSHFGKSKIYGLQNGSARVNFS